MRRAQNRRFSLCPVPHALATHYFLRITRARGRSFLRGRKALLNDFWYFWSYKSTIKEKFLHVSSRVVEGADPYKLKPEYIQQTKQKIKVPSAFSFDEEGAKEKATKKKTPKEDFALCGVLTQSRRRRHTCYAYVSMPVAVDGSRLPFKKGRSENFRLALLRAQNSKSVIGRIKWILPFAVNKQGEKF